MLKRVIMSSASSIAAKNMLNFIVLGDAKFVSSMNPDVLGDGFVFKLSNNKTIINRQRYLDKLSIASSFDDVQAINVLPRNYSDNAVIKGTDGKRLAYQLGRQICFGRRRRRSHDFD